MKTSYRITVRQLESLVRLSEALARLSMDVEVCVRFEERHIDASQIKPKHVLEAVRLLRKSIIHVETDDVVLEDSDDESNEEQETPQTNKVEETSSRNDSLRQQPLEERPSAVDEPPSPGKFVLVLFVLLN